MLLFCTIFAAHLLTNAAQVASAVANPQPGLKFTVNGTVTFPCKGKASHFAIEDESGAISMVSSRKSNLEHLPRGSFITATGVVEFIRTGHGIARCDSAIVLGKKTPSEPDNITASEFKSGKFDNHIVRVRGIVREVFRDEIDFPFVFLTLCCGNETVYAAFPNTQIDIREFNKLTDADITITGLCSPGDIGTRWQIGHILDCTGPNAFEIHRMPSKDPFDVPTLTQMHQVDPATVMTMTRHRVAGTIIAIWQGNRILIRDDLNLLHNVELAGSDIPSFGNRVEVVGLLETDLYRINLSGAIWRPLEGPQYPLANAEPIETKALLLDRNGAPKIQSTAHGKAFSLNGIVIDKQGTSSLSIKDGDFTITIDASSCPQALDCVTIGCKIQVAGTCIMETEKWRPYSVFPHAKGILLAVRTPTDIRILARPPWWTPRRLMVVIGSMLATILIILTWNRILNRLVERRSRELLREQAGRVGDKLKVGERTRLAVELHDSLSQTLTGVSFQIDAAEKARQNDPSQIKKYLDIARRTLQSCREELRNCLWDLRNNALEEVNAEVAIRKTVEPQIGDAELIVDFKVPRAKITDNTFHAILCIVRELAVNAVRHGAANHITICGRLEPDKLICTVQDNGYGFDPCQYPGMDEGHFGLRGVSERLDSLGGSINICSSLGNGTIATFTILL